MQVMVLFTESLHGYYVVDQYAIASAGVKIWSYGIQRPCMC